MHDFEAVLPALRASRCLAEHAGRPAPVDNAKAMQAAGQRTLVDPRITWVVSKAEDVADHIME